jgi:hypothetical protein
MIEITTFRLGVEVDEADFLEADRLVQTRFSPRRPGFLRRTTARGEDGSWLVLVLWGSADAAAAAAEAAATDPWTTALSGLLDPASVRVQRYAELD